MRILSRRGSRNQRAETSHPPTLTDRNLDSVSPTIHRDVSVLPCVRGVRDSRSSRPWGRAVDTPRVEAGSVLIYFAIYSILRKIDLIYFHSKQYIKEDSDRAI